MTIRELQLTSDDIRRQASRAYISERASMPRPADRRTGERRR